MKRILFVVAAASIAACGGDDGISSGDELKISQACIDEPNQCEALFVGWSLRRDASELACDEAGVERIELEVTPAGYPARYLSFDCSAGVGLTPPVEAGAYLARVRLFGGGSMLAESAADGVSFEVGDGLDELGFFFSFECPAARNCAGR